MFEVVSKRENEIYLLVKTLNGIILYYNDAWESQLQENSQNYKLVLITIDMFYHICTVPDFRQ